MKSNVMWDITPYSLLKVNRRFGGTYRLHLQGRISRARYQREIRWQAELSASRIIQEAGGKWESGPQFPLARRGTE
jgi:hypothetical protein